MTREDAKQIISNIDKAYRNFTADEYKALEMAIQALSQEPTSEMVHIETLHQVMWERDIAIGQLKELGYDFGQKIEPCTDAVSREAVLDTLDRMDKILDVDRTVENYKDLLKESYQVLPPVTQKSGKWNEYYTSQKGNDVFNCKECGHTFTVTQGKDNMNYCPNCGAYMREEQTE